jgi:alpha-glucoside transport system substrate-binding protein
VQSITTTAFQEGGLPILDGACFMHRQAQFYSVQWGEGIKVGADGDVFAFYFPSMDDTKPTLVSAEFIAAFSDSEATQAVQNYLSSTEWVDSRASLGDGTWLTANKNVDTSVYEQNEVSKLAYGILQDPEAVVRFDGSDLMPATVGSGSLWKAMTDWINGSDTKKVLDQVEASWPTS